jgi:hypothetical protein
MKVSMGKMFVLLTIVLSFSASSAAWAHVESIEGPYTVEGTVAYVWGDSLAIACGYTMEPNPVTGCPLIVSGLGPAGWWSVNQVAFPAKGQEVLISIYRVTSSVGDIKYVLGEVIDNGEGDGLVLRIPLYEGDVIFVLDPAWSKMEPLAEATALSSAPTEDTECTCKCTCKGEECACDCSCDSADCGDCVPVGDEHKWRGVK